MIRFEFQKKPYLRFKKDLHIKVYADIICHYILSVFEKYLSVLVGSLLKECVVNIRMKM